MKTFKPIVVMAAALLLSACANDTGKAFKYDSAIDASTLNEERNDHDFAAWNDTRSRLTLVPKDVKQLQEVNDFVNAMPVWMGAIAHWQSPRMLYERGGVCHDYAFAKHEMLVELGWSREDLRVVTLQTPPGSEFSRHAVLVVRQGGHYYVLDNLAQKVQVDHWSMDKMKFIGQITGVNSHVISNDIDPPPYYR